MINILPSILTSDPEEIKRRMNLMSSHVSCMHVDVMDGVYVKSTSLPISGIADCLNTLEYSCGIEMHLMVHEPVQYIEDLRRIKNISRIIIHKDSLKDVQKTIADFRNIGVKIGLSIALDEEVNKKLPSVDFFLVLAEDEPGFSGTPFNTEALDQILELKETFPDDTVEVDGGINNINAKLCIRHGANEFAVNSFIFKSQDPVATLLSLQQLKPDE